MRDYKEYDEMKDEEFDEYKSDGTPRKYNKNINYYIDKEDFYNEVVKFQNSSPIKEERQASEHLGVLLLTLSEHVLKMPSFYRYQKEVKEDMRSFALYKMMKGLQTFNISMPNAKDFVFAYFTKACIYAYYTFLSQHYKHVNIMRDLKSQYLQKADFIDPRVKQEMMKELDEQNEYVSDSKAKTAHEREKRARTRRSRRA